MIAAVVLLLDVAAVAIFFTLFHVNSTKLGPGRRGHRGKLDGCRNLLRDHVAGWPKIRSVSVLALEPA